VRCSLHGHDAGSEKYRPHFTSSNGRSVRNSIIPPGLGAWLRIFRPQASWTREVTQPAYSDSLAGVVARDICGLCN